MKKKFFFSPPAKKIGFGNSKASWIKLSQLWHWKQTCISNARINDSKQKQIVNLNKRLFGVRKSVWTYYISAWVFFFRKALNSHYEYSSWILNRSVNLILAILKVISWVRMLYEFMCSFFNKIHLILQALFYCQKYDV